LQVRAKYGDLPTKALSRLNPTAVQSNVRKLGVNTAKKAYLSESVKLAQLRKAYNYDTPILLIQAWIEDLSAFLGFKAERKANSSQLDELAELFYEEAYFLSIAELGYFFTNLKKGRYGDFYQTLDPLKVLKYLIVYLEERDLAVSLVNKEQGQTAKASSPVFDKLYRYYAKLKAHKKNLCTCENVEVGSHSNQVELPRPPHMDGRTEGILSATICIDACIADEVKQLWCFGVHTTGCCCGHHKVQPYIGVIPEDVELMKNLGYKLIKGRPCEFERRVV
jgi:hypothetical protein